MFENMMAIVVDLATAKLIPAIVLLVIGAVIIKLVNKIVRTALGKTKLEKAAHSLILSVANVALYIICGIVMQSWILPLYSIVMPLPTPEIRPPNSAHSRRSWPAKGEAVATSTGRMSLMTKDAPE